MLREVGTVSAITEKLAIVQTRNQLTCASCKVADACGNGIVENFLSSKIFSTSIINRLNAQVGDEVILEIPKSSITKASLIAYFVPLLGLIIFAIITSLLHLEENLVIFSSLFGLMLGLLVTKYYNHKIKNNELYLPKMVSITDTSISCDDKTDVANTRSINVKVI